MGMGMSAVSFVDDATSGYWNPAGLTHLKADHQLMLMHAPYFAGIAKYDFGAFATVSLFDFGGATLKSKS